MRVRPSSRRPLQSHNFRVSGDVRRTMHGEQQPQRWATRLRRHRASSSLPDGLTALWPWLATSPRRGWPSRQVGRARRAGAALRHTIGGRGGLESGS